MTERAVNLTTSIALGVLTALVVAGAYILSHEEPAASEEAVYSASMDAGFTRKQAIFLRHGPFEAVSLCNLSDFSEDVCSFLAEGIHHRHSDAEYDANCAKSGLSNKQCLLLRRGVKGYRVAFSAGPMTERVFK